MNQYIERDNFVYIANFISPERAYELSKEFKKFTIDTDRKGDKQAEQSRSAYNYIGFLELLCEKTPDVSAYLGETVLPTYTYARVYHHGSDLIPHVDRPACEVSLTLHLDGDTDWPIFIKKPNGETVSITLKPGDAIMYLGCQAEHWREQFNGQEYVQAFFHYVRSRGENSYAFFDKARKPEDTSLNDSTGIYAPKAETQQPIVPAVPIAAQSYAKNLTDYIVVFDDLVPDELCQAILDEYPLDSQEWGAGAVSGGANRNVRNVDIVHISTPAVISINQERRQSIDNYLFQIANKAITKYNELFPEARIENDTGYDLLRYTEGQFYIQHTDSFKAMPRSVSCSFALNDNYDGGEFAFFNRELKYKLKKGSVLMFPSNFMYPHEIMPVTKGTRYSIITWFI
jgi:hypothetical protein